MTLGKVIRKYRKLRNLTQEEMAGRLGVTAPAVNKWENENSYPDITLIAPIARLLGISLDTLLSFREELTVEEIGAIIREADSRFQREAFEEILAWAKKNTAGDFSVLLYSGIPGVLIVVQISLLSGQKRRD